MNKKKILRALGIIITIIIGIWLGSPKKISQHEAPPKQSFPTEQEDMIISGTVLTPEGEELLYRSYERIATVPKDEHEKILTYREQYQETNHFTPGLYIVKFENNPEQNYLQSFFLTENQTFSQYLQDEKTRRKNKDKPAFLETVRDTLKNLDDDFTIISITRPKLRFHQPKQTGVFRNNYYYITFEKWYEGENREQDQILDSIEQLPNTEYIVRKNTFRTLQNTDYPDDPRTNQMRYLNNTETYDAREAIDYTTNRNAQIGLIEGVNGNHPDLNNNIAQNIGGGATSHGTHTAGSIVAETNNNQGVPAIANDNAKLIIKRGGGANCTNCWDSALDGVVSRGAQIVSISQLAGFWMLNSSYASHLNDIFNGHSQVLFLVAAGNENLNPETDYGRNGRQYCCNAGDPAYNAAPGTWGIFPGAVTSPNVMTVAASNENDGKASFTCYGGRIDIASPGTNILSTDISGYSKKSGTSMATPIAASLAGLLKGLDPGLSAIEIKNIIEDTADPISRQGGAGRINVCNAVNAIGYPCPFPPEDNCTDGIDNNGDGTTDCGDPTCGITTELEDINSCGEQAIIDATTADASSYLRQPGGQTTPTITVSPDQTTTYSVTIEKNNGCNSTLETTVTITNPEPEICTDGIDNDCNGSIDCNDNQCSNNNACQGGGGGNPPTPPPSPGGFQLQSERCVEFVDRNSNGETNCFDGEDNDGNGSIDCGDPNCRYFDFCGASECHCCDGLDNDGDGYIDCEQDNEDPDCDCDQITSTSIQKNTTEETTSSDTQKTTVETESILY